MTGERFYLIALEAFVLAESPDRGWLGDQADTWMPTTVLSGAEASLDADLRPAVEEWLAGDDSAYMTWRAAEEVLMDLQEIEGDLLIARVDSGEVVLPSDAFNLLDSNPLQDLGLRPDPAMPEEFFRDAKWATTKLALCCHMALEEMGRHDLARRYVRELAIEAKHVAVGRGERLL